MAYIAAGLAKIYTGDEAADFMKVDVNNARVPDLVGISQYRTVYTAKERRSPSTAATTRRIATCRSWSPVVRSKAARS